MFPVAVSMSLSFFIVLLKKFRTLAMNCFLMDFSLKKSFNSHGSLIRLDKKISIEDEIQPILSSKDPKDRHDYDVYHKGAAMKAVDSADRKEVTVKIDECGEESFSTKNRAKEVMDQNKNVGGKIWRESSVDFWNEDEQRDTDNGAKEGFDFGKGGQVCDDPPSKLIGQFLHKQKASGDVSLDMDLEMEELRNDRNFPPVAESPMKSRTSKELKVAFHSPSSNVLEVGSNETVRRRFKDSPADVEHYGRRTSASGGSDEEILRCTSNASHRSDVSTQRKSSLLRVKTKSRLMDPPEEPDLLSGRVPKSGPVPVPKSGILKSGFLGRSPDEDDDDPFWEEDLPDEFKKSKLSVISLLEWVSLITIVGAVICTFSIPFLREKHVWKLNLWKWEVLILVLICGRLVSGWGIRILVFFIERNFLLRKRVLYFVYGVRRAVQNCLWLGLVLIAWRFLFDKKVQRETNADDLKYVTKVLFCLVLGTLLWLIKTLIVKVLASSFHVSTYFDRIQESLFNQFVIETLSGPPLVEIRRNEEEEEKLVDEVKKLQNAGATIPTDLRASAFATTPKSGRVIGSGKLPKGSPRKSSRLSGALSSKGDDGITIDHLHKWNPKNISAWNMKRLMNIIRHGSLITLDEQILDTTEGDESATQIRSEVEAKAAAKKIFQNVTRHGSRYIYLEDLMRFMQEDEAVKTMSLFEGASETRRISKSSLKNWVVNAFRERRALALTLNDTKTAVNTLHRTVNILVAIIIVIIWLLILEIATTKFLLFASSQIVVVAFVFGNTCKTVFEAIVFLFVMHPFDVGDRCEIEGVQMVVEEMNILTTVFLRFDNTKIIFPNSTLATKPIFNFYRSPDMGDAIEFSVHICTPAEKIAAIRQRITSFIDNKKEHWCSGPMIVMKELEGLNRIRFAVWPTHKMNFQDMGERFVRRSLLIEEMVKIFKELDIDYRLYPLDINIRALPTSTRLPHNWPAAATTS